MFSAPHTAAIISLEGSLRPRSISERYCGDPGAGRDIDQTGTATAAGVP